MGELAKLGEKVKARKRAFLRKENEGEEVEEDMKESRVVQKRDSNCSNSMLSEYMVCLLMDRFAPS